MSEVSTLTYTDINKLLHRNVLDGSEYDALVPHSDCVQSDMGNGMTDHSVKVMAEMVYNTFQDMEKVAPLLKGYDLQETCDIIHDFCYSYFQYYADKSIQYLRSPSCSWAQRFEGIDCKSYSIVASAILLNLDINHYIRRVRQPGFEPDRWSHVYVIVPVDQKNGNLDKGYYTIDGTVPETEEGLFIEKDDLYMSMQHYGLRGGVPAGLAVNLDDLKGLSIDSVKNLFSSGWSLNCIGGTYTGSDFSRTVSYFVPWFNERFDAINNYIANNTPGTALLDEINKLLKSTQQIYEHSKSTASKNWDSNCSESATNSYKAIGAYYNNIVFQAFLPWLTQYFYITYGSETVKKGGYEPRSGFKKQDWNGNISARVLTSIEMKPNIGQIMRFEITPYVAGKDNGTVNLNQFLQGLTDVLAVFGDNNGGNGNNYDVDPETGKPLSPNVKNAGLGIVAGVLVFGAAAGLIFSQMKDKGAGAKSKTAK